MDASVILDVPMAENGHCATGRPVTPEAARRIIIQNIDAISGTEAVPLHAAVGRIAAEGLRSAVAVPSFDNAAVDGFGIHVSDLNIRTPLTLPIVGRAAAGDNADVLSRSGTALRIFAGAKVPAGIGSVVFERGATRSGNEITLNVLPEVGANIRQRGEDVTPGTTIVSKGTTLDARHIAILAVAGISHIAVRRRLRIGVMSIDPDSGDAVRAIRSMLLALLASPSIEAISLRVADTQTALSAALHDAAKDLDLLITSVGVSGHDRCRLEPAVRAAGGICQKLSLAMRPGKPIATGRIGPMHVLALPGNHPVASFVHYLFFGRSMIGQLIGAADTDLATTYGRAAETFEHKAGRAEFFPACVVGRRWDGLPRIRKLDRGGSARLLPLVSADGLAEIGPSTGDVPRDGLLAFHSFSASLAL